MNLISPHSKIIKRHQNPVGIALRPVAFTIIAYGLWSHSFLHILGGIIFETSLWFVIPEVETPPQLIASVVEEEINWLNAKWNSLKLLSIILFVFASVLVFSGLWLRNIYCIAIGFSLLVIFAIFMKIIVKKK